MSEINVIIRTADQTKKAEVALEANNTGADVIQAAISNWALPADTDYSLVCTTSGKSLTPTTTLAENEVKSGAILEVQPVLVAGHTQ